ncbi:MAG TPA: molybdopterin-dependent oxidoreductase [Limnochordia bacterium]|nr:molybdopterin-dependent oxidoreductase [Limnochordia bacterium]
MRQAIRTFGIGLIGAAAAGAVAWCGRLAGHWPFPPELMAARLFAWLPMRLFETGVRLLGHWAKWLAFGGMIAVYLAIGGLLAVAAPRLARRLSPVAAWALATAVLAAAGLFVFLPAVGLDWAGRDLVPRPGLPVPLVFLLYAAIYSAVVVVWVARARRAGTTSLGAGAVGAAPAPAARVDRGKRAFLRAGVAWAGALAVLNWRALAALAQAAEPLFAKLQAITPVFTRQRDFYHVSKNLFDPTVPQASWRLSVAGAIERPYELTLEQLKGLPSVAMDLTLCCISNPVGGDLISNAHWRGVPLQALLEHAGVQDGAVDVELVAYDEYTDSIPLAKALHPDTLVAYEMNGAPLPDDHGAPARLLVPGIYGMKNVKWLTRIQVVKADFKGYWEDRGWSDEAVIRTMSRIDFPNRTRVPLAEAYVGGIAFAGERGISKVEVSFDRGHTWRAAQLGPEIGRYCWRQWTLPWPEGLRGRVSITARAYDGQGAPQLQTPAYPGPEGATGYHVINVTVS